MIEIEHRHGNKDIKFSYKVVEKEKLEENEAIKEALKDSDQLFEFDLSDSNGKKVEFSSDSNKGVVTITIPYNKPVSANEVKVFYISPTGEKIDMNGKYDPSTKTITFDTTHFSYYSIVAVYEESITTTTTTPVTTITTTSTTTATTTIITTTTTTAITTLPQTGYSDIYSIIIYGAGILTLLGVATIVLSKRKEI
jgi:LPXTG-motif cell wall-anchored protein